ncbi:MAG: acetylglutamate kinase [Myxococcota bacterium]|nr:acetylglutamate kinase [Myxococcota bacterium]MDW8361876.1 acetylglutamate kinase [Myxococcales bacterium]
MRELVEKAAVLHEALPYIRRFHGQVFVVKYGGHAMLEPALRASFARDVVLMKLIGLHPIVVHGGGPQIDERLEQLGVRSERLDGLRVTDARTMQVVEMVLGGTLNQEIVSLVCAHGGRAVGLTGRDDGFVRAERIERMRTRSGREVDPGRVGRVREVRPELLRRLVEAGFIPVVAPIAVDDAGESLNVNADTVAGKVAEALGAAKLLLLTDAPGIRGRDGSVLSSLSAADAARLQADGVIDGGMIPKVACALEALEGGVGKVHVIDGRLQHAVLLELFTDRGVGTEIVRGPATATVGS